MQKISDKDRNTLIVSFLKIREMLRDKKKSFSQDFDGKNKDSKLYGLLNFIKNNNLIEEKDKNDLTSKIENNTNDAAEVISLIDTQINKSLSDLGYEENNNSPKKEDLINDKKEINLVENYQQIITSIEKMISELDKQMKELDVWINKLSDSIHYDYNKTKKEEVVNEESNEKSFEYDGVVPQN